MVNEKVIGAVLGKDMKKAHMFKDSDKDGVINVMDCKPFNPKEQGLIDTAKEKFRQGASFVKRRAGEAIEQGRERREVSREAAVEERRKQAKETAVFRERERGRRQRESIKRGGFVGSFGGTLSQISQSSPTRGITNGGPPARRPVRRASVRRVTRRRKPIKIKTRRRAPVRRTIRREEKRPPSVVEGLRGLGL